MQEKLFIKNRKWQKISVLVEEPKNPRGLVFVMHGLGGFKEQPHIETYAKTFFDNGYTSVSFDATNSIGESDGKYEDATITNYYEDLEDVVGWAKSQSWYKEPFCLAGHSLGGICTALFAEKYPELVKALAPISTIISGKLSIENKLSKGSDLDKWKQTGWRIESNISKPGIIKRLKWSHIEDRLKYDLLPNVDKLTMPVLLIVGENDTSTPPPQQQLLYEKLPGKKEIHIIKNASHAFRGKQYLDEIQQIFDKWIKNL